MPDKPGEKRFPGGKRPDPPTCRQPAPGAASGAAPDTPPPRPARLTPAVRPERRDPAPDAPRARDQQPVSGAPRRGLLPARPRLVLAWVLAVILVGIMVLPGLFGSIMPRSTLIAPLFVREVRYWEASINRWAEAFALDPNLVASVIQIESCGHPDVISPAGAQGLFQVMPMHFTEAEQSRMTDPETNAQRGMGVLVDCMQRAGGDFGLAMACYNGGPRWIGVPQTSWPAETQRYYRWGTGIYADAQRGADRSATLESWLAAGGWSLCQRASAALGMLTATPYMIPVEFRSPTLPAFAPGGSGLPTPALPGALPTLAEGDRLIPPTASLPGALPTFDGSGRE